jgi:hypothetical protein
VYFLTIHCFGLAGLFLNKRIRSFRKPCGETTALAIDLSLRGIQ